MTELEQKDDVEIHDRLYEAFGESVTIDNNSDWSYKHYRITPEVVVTLKESMKFISEGTTGLVSWQASIALSEWILKHLDQFNGKEILELGSGTGLLGFLLGKIISGSRIILSDCHDSVLRLLHENHQINFASTSNNSIEILDLPWETFEQSLLVNRNISPDFILAADVIYDDTLFEPLVRTINEIFQLKQNDVRLILACTVRNHKTLQKFLEMLSKIIEI